jgi:hypothetical protein
MHVSLFFLNTGTISRNHLSIWREYYTMHCRVYVGICGLNVYNYTWWRGVDLFFFDEHFQNAHGVQPTWEGKSTGHADLLWKSWFPVEKKQGRSVHTYDNYDTYMTLWEFNIAMKYHGVFIRESSIHGQFSTSQTVSRYREGRC